MPFENVSCQGRIENFFREGAPNFVTFFNRIFCGRVNYKQLKKQKDSRGAGGISPENFCKFAYCNGHFSAFWTISRQSLFIFLASIFECFTKHVVFCWHSFDYACLRRLRHIAMKRFEIMEKFYSSKALLKKAGRDASPISHLGSDPGQVWSQSWASAEIFEGGGGGQKLFDKISVKQRFCCTSLTFLTLFKIMQ